MPHPLQHKYREVFLNSLGQQVLADILMLCHFGATLNPDNYVQVAEYNVGVVILSRLGILGPGTLSEVIGSIAHITPNESIEEEG